MINIGIIGCGTVMNRYCDVFLNEKIIGAEVIAVCDKNRQLADKRAKELDAKSYYSIEDLFEKVVIDLAIILSSSGFHYQHTKYALENECHTLTEKPIALRLEHAEELHSLSHNNNLMAGVVFQNRYNNSIKYLHSKLSEGLFGKHVLSTVRVRWCRYQDYYDNSWHGTWEMDGGVIAQQAIHHLDVLQWLGGEIKCVSAKFTRRLNKLEADDTTVAILEFEDGSLGAIEATTSARPIDYEASFSILAENGMAEIGGIALNKIEKWNLIDSDTNPDIIMRENSQEVKDGFGLGHGPLIQDVVDRLNSNSKIPPISIEDGIESLKLVHAIYKSAETGLWVFMKDNQQAKFLGL